MSSNEQGTTAHTRIRAALAFLAGVAIAAYLAGPWS